MFTCHFTYPTPNTSRFFCHQPENKISRDLHVVIKEFTEILGQQRFIILPLHFTLILGPVYDNENENWRILTNKEIYASVKSILQSEA